ncbi:CD244 protein, partial [Chauna torquata]|nr:CD244 protein [Chauna torquata]
GTPGCTDRAVPAGGELRLLLEEPLPAWERVEWRAALDAGFRQRILTASKDEVRLAQGHFSGRATFQLGNLSLQINPVTQADSGNYSADLETASGFIAARCFRVSVWEPIGQPRLEARLLQREQGWCNLSLACTVPGATTVSYSWSHDGEPLGHRNVLWVHGNTTLGIYVCNASNPTSWSTASIDTTAVCLHPAPGLFSIILWWAVAVMLVLAASIVAFVTCWCWQKRRKDSPAAHIDPLTVYEEVGKVRTGQDPNRNSEAAAVGSTIYSMVCTKAQRPGCPQDPESCTIYSAVQPSRKQPLLPCSAPQSPSFKRKTLHPALVSTAYVEV